MRQILALAAFVAVVLPAVPSVADVTIKPTSSMTSDKITSERSSVIYVKGMKGRLACQP